MHRASASYESAPSTGPGRAEPHRDVPESSFERLTRIAAELLSAPVALASLAQGDLQYPRGVVGLAREPLIGRGVPLPGTPCGEVAAKGEPILFEDVHEAAGISFPAELREQGLVAYAGVPIRSRTGEVLGTFCVLDRVCRRWTEREVSLMQDLAACVATEIELRIEGALRQVEQRYRQLIETASEPIGVAVEGRVSYLNAAAARLLGASEPEELYGREVWDFAHPDFHPAIAERFARAMAGEEVGPMVQRWRRLDGREIWVEVVSSLVSHQGVPALQIMARDVTERVRADERLQNREAYYRALIENAADLITVVEADGIVRYESPSVVRVLGPGREDVPGRRVIEDVHPDDRDSVRDAFARMLESRGGDVVPMEFRYRNSAGEWRWLECAGRNLLDEPAVRGIVINSRDVTERRAADRALRESESRFRQLAASIPQVFWMISGDLTQVRYVSPAYESVWGRSREAFRSDPRAWIEGVHPEDRPYVIECFERLGRTPMDVQYRVVRPDGSVRWVHDRAFYARGPDGEVESVVGLAQDITEQRRAEEVLRQSEERFRGIADSLGEGLVLTDTEGRVTYLNARATEILGYTREEIMGTVAEEYLAGPPDRGEQARRRTRRLQGMSEQYETEVRHKDGHSVALEVHAAPLRTARGEVVGIVGAFSDITERRQLEEQLLQSQKMEAVGRLAGGIAHDSNNMLTAIQGFTQLLELEVATEEGREYLREIQLATARSVSLTRQLLAFSRKQVLQPRVLCVNAVVSGLERLLQRLISENIRIETELAVELPTIHADPGQVEQVVLNLVVNARDAMPAGGSLRLRTADRTLGSEGPAACASVPPGHYVCLAVEDTGCGMSPEVLERIFEPFYTTKDVGEGTGLGLSTVYGIVRQSGGYVTVESVPGEGSCFTVFFPATERPCPEPAPVERASAVREGVGTVLVVEDEPAVRHLTEAILRRAGYEVLTAADGEAALEVARRHEKGIDVLVTDIVMPFMSGPALAQRMTAEIPGLRVIFMSGYAEEAVQRQGRLAREAPLLEKPFSPDALISCVRDVLSAAAQG